MRWIIYNWKSFWKDPWQARYVVALALVNAAGSVYGYYWYAGQLASTPWRLWLFVPDSPLATTLFAAVLALWLLGYRNVFFNVVAFTACIKYGLWAVIVISQYWAGGGEIRFTEAMLWVSHLGMAAQGCIYLRICLFTASPEGRRGVAGLVLAGAAAWMLLNDFLDYYLGIYPYLYSPGQVQLGAVSAVSLSLLLILSVITLPFLNLANNSR